MNLFESVAFDAPVTVDDGYGGTDTQWQEKFTTRANFKYLRGGETVQAARLEGRQPVVVMIRAHSKSLAVTPAYRMRDVRRGTMYNVRSIVPSDDRMYVEITVESGVAV